LLKLRSLAVTRRVAPSDAAMKSFVVVFPTLPVTATTGTSSRRRPHAPSASRAAAVSATRTAVPGRSAATGSLVKYAGAPAVVASGMKSCPSRSATIGTNSCPGRRLRVSNETPSTSTSGPTSVPPVASATWDASNLMGRNGTVASVSNDRIHLVVLFGGQSAEHDVSCTTAAHVLAAADPDKYRITPIGISTDGEWALADEAVHALARGPAALPSRLDPRGDRLSPSTILGEAVDAPERTVVLPLLHGPMGEDGTVQGLLELANVAYVGSGVLGSAVAMDKAMAKQILGAAGIPQARHRAFAEHEMTPGMPGELAAELGLPCFVKPANMGSSVGVSKAKTVEQLRDAIEYALTYDEWIVVEEAIVGREIEIAVIGNEDPFVSVPGEILPGDEFYSYDDKYVNDASVGVIPAPLSPDQVAGEPGRRGGRPSARRGGGGGRRRSAASPRAAAPRARWRCR
jgi:D-alanine--D-alanine ligase